MPDTRTDDQTDSSAPRRVAQGQRFKAPLEHVAPNPLNIREDWEWEDDAFEDLKDNVDSIGVQQDPTVISFAVYAERYPTEAQSLPEHTYWVIGAGERRYRAAVANGLTVLPMVLRDDQINNMDELIWSENQLRAGLHPLQEGQLLQRFKNRGLTAEQIQTKLGRRNKGLSEAAISKKIRLYNEVPAGSVRIAIGRRELGVDPAYLLLTKYGPDGMEAAYERMLSQSLTAKALIELDFPKPAPPAAEPELEAKAEDRSPQPPLRPVTAESRSNTDQAGDPAPKPTSRIPSQPADGGGSTGTGAAGSPNPRSGEDLEADDNEHARLKAATELLASRRDLAEIAEPVFIALINNAPAEVHALAQRLLDASGLDVPPTAHEELARRAEALAIADAELRLSRRSGGYDPTYLRGLTRHGYELTADENDLLMAVSVAEQG
ncbi:ParB/RepB/Spo0J family partition protein [Streptomyces sp. NRRL S-350]|uniref:ParB/RepB/Spo0J family partition protein n=1 Tax=Streptomyces sp. NRRL S-350 TaxID=1463902 RepID=UPI0004BE7C5B|nr:ParB N-terminal domain-containing protein [Streptomyces sp. NRRL S-350]